MAKKTTAAERKVFIEEQRGESPIHIDSGRKLPVSMDFIDRAGNIVGPTKDNPYPNAKGGYSGKPAERRGHYDSTRAYKENEGANHYHRRHNLNQEFFGIVSVIGLLCSIFFLSSNLTGNAIANMTNSTSSFLGAGLLIIGLVAGLFWMRSGKR